MEEDRKVLKALKKYKEAEMKEYEKDRKKGIPIRINPNSYIAKEIEYQTIILKQIEQHLFEIKMLLNKSNINK